MQNPLFGKLNILRVTLTLGFLSGRHFNECVRCNLNHFQRKVILRQEKGFPHKFRSTSSSSSSLLSSSLSSSSLSSLLPSLSLVQVSNNRSPEVTEAFICWDRAENLSAFVGSSRNNNRFFSQIFGYGQWEIGAIRHGLTRADCLKTLSQKLQATLHGDEEF